MHREPDFRTILPSPERLSAEPATTEPLLRPAEDPLVNTRLHSLTRSISFNAALAAIACGIAFSMPARADYTNGEPLTKVVSYADLNMKGEAAAPTLYGRLRLAATQVCAPFSGTTLAAKAKWHECFDQALARSVADVNEPVLTAYYQNRTGKNESQARMAKAQ